MKNGPGGTGWSGDAQAHDCLRNGSAQI